MVCVVGEIVINQPIETVFDFVADERNEPCYNPGMTSAEMITGVPINTGTRFKAVIKSIGRNSEMLIEITEYERPRQLSSSTHSSMMDIDGTLTFNKSGTGTHMQWCWNIKPRGLFKLMTPLIKSIGKRQEEYNWTNMKQYLEKQEI